jgi:hypothetical protein
MPPNGHTGCVCYLLNKDKDYYVNSRTACYVKIVQVAGTGTISRRTSDSTDKPNGQNPLGAAIVNVNALELLLLRSTSYEVRMQKPKYEQDYGQKPK